MLALLVRFRLLPGHGEAFDLLAADVVRGVRAREPGTLVYLTHTSDDPSERVFYECYTSRAAFDAHEQQPHTQLFLDGRAQHLAAEPEVNWLRMETGVVLDQVHGSASSD